MSDITNLAAKSVLNKKKLRKWKVKHLILPVLLLLLSLIDYEKQNLRQQKHLRVKAP